MNILHYGKIAYVVKSTVKDKTGFLLEPEVIFAGDWS